MSTGTRPDLSALLGSRICHDLISPLGAIGNGLELLGMSGIAESPEMALISDSVASANARIRFFRVAFGAAAPGQQIGAGELTSVLEDSYAGGRIAVCHDLAGAVARQDAKLALLLLLCIESALPTGGEISISAGPAGWALRGSGPRLKYEPHLWEALTAPAPEGAFSAAEVQFALLPGAAAQAGRALSVELGPAEVIARF